MYRKHPKLFISLLFLLFLCIAGVAGYIWAQNEPRIVQKDDTAELSSVEVDSDNARIEPDAAITWDYVYTMCGHHQYIQTTADETLAGMTFSELQESRPDVRIVSFDTDNLVLQKSFNCYCPDHYILKRYDNSLAVYRTSAGTEQLYIYLEVPISFANISAEQQQVLTVGKVFGSLADLEHYLEDIET